MEDNNRWTTAWKGFIVGATMIIPGVSGGTMAIILGIYDKLISSVSSFGKNVKENFVFLVTFAFSAVLGLFLFSTPLSWLLKYYEMPTIYFFIGAVLGGIPLIEKKSGIQKISLSVIGYLVLGAMLVVIISKIPNGFLGEERVQGIVGWGTLFFAGIISAAALILPGISFSHFLLILGLYDRLLEAIKIFDLTVLFPLGLGILAGVFLLSRLLEKALNNYPKAAYLMILGFMVGSIAQIFPGIPGRRGILLSIMTSFLGFFATYRSEK